MGVKHSSYLEAYSRIAHEAMSLVNDLISLVEAKDKRIEVLESQVEELENDKLTLASRGQDLDDIVEG